MARAGIHLGAMRRHRARRVRDVMTIAVVMVKESARYGLRPSSGTEPDAAPAPSQSS
jgi:hypothetical protein